MHKEIYFSLPETIFNLHTHGQGMKQRRKTTIKQVLMEAKSALINILGFMPNTSPPITSIPILNAVIKQIEIGKRKLGIEHDQFIWFGVTDNNIAACVQALRYRDVIGLKIYPKRGDGSVVTTGTIGVSDDDALLEAMLSAREVEKTVAIHCDDPNVIIYGESDTITSEAAYIGRVMQLAELVPDIKLMFCHVSNRRCAELILDAQRHGLKALIELCPHYLWFDNNGTNWNRELPAEMYFCHNRLRGPHDREFLISLLSTDNRGIVIGSDDAQHLPEEKLKGIGGLPSNQEFVPVIVTLAHENYISEKRVADLLCYNAARFFNLKVADKSVSYRFEKRIDDCRYNNGSVINPWLGSELYFPVL